MNVQSLWLFNKPKIDVAGIRSSIVDDR